MIRVRQIAVILTSLWALLAAPAPAQEAPDIAGAWHGTVAASPFGGQANLILTVERGEDGVLTARLENREQGPGRRQPVADLKAEGGKLTFAVPNANATYSATWNEAEQRWSGTLVQGQAVTLDFVRGLPAPRLRVEGLDGIWAGVAERNGIRIPQVLRISTHEWGTNVLYDSPEQMMRGLPLDSLEREGRTVRVSFMGLTHFEGELSEDLNRLTGKWVTPGQPDIPMDLVRTQPATARLQTASVPTAPPRSPENWSVPDDRTIGELIEARLARYPGAGMAIGVVEPGGQRTVARGLTAAGGAPIDDRTIFEIGSITKVFTAMILADMAVKGEVALDDPAEKYLPAGARLPERGRKITLRDLAMHLSGLPRNPGNVALFLEGQDPFAEALLLDYLASWQPPREPGTVWEYSNTGMALLGYLLGRAAGSDYETLLRERITGPLGMEDTAVTLSDAQKARFAQGHSTFMEPAPAIGSGGIAPAGSIASSAADMRKFIAAVLDPASPLAPAVELMLAQRHAMRPGVDMALGWIVLKSDAPGAGEILTHGGLTAGSAASLAIGRGIGRGVAGMVNMWAEATIGELVQHLLGGAPLSPALAAAPE